MTYLENRNPNLKSIERTNMFLPRFYNTTTDFRDCNVQFTYQSSNSLEKAKDKIKVSYIRGICRT